MLNPIWLKQDEFYMTMRHNAMLSSVRNYIELAGM